MSGMSGEGSRAHTQGVVRSGKTEDSGGRENFGQVIDFGLEERGRAFVPQDNIGQLDFFRQRQLLGNSLPSEQSRNSALLQSGKLLSWRTRDTNREIKPILQPLLEEERHLHNPALVWFRRKGGSPQRKHPRMSKFLKPL